MLTIPTYDGSGQATHPSVLYVPEKWNGYRWWMAMTPLAFFDESLENPSILASHDGTTWVVPNGLRNPIDRATKAPYHSDPDIVIDETDGTMYCFYRQTAGSASTLRIRSSKDGVHWSPLTVVDQPGQDWVSMAVVQHQGVWHMFTAHNLGSTERVIAHRTAPAPLGPWSQPVAGVLRGKGTNRNPWHLDVVRHDGRWLAVILDVSGMTTGTDGKIILASSADGNEWWCSPHILSWRADSWDSESLYRPSMYIYAGYAHVYYGGNRLVQAGEPRGSWWIGKADPIPLNRFPQV